MFKTNRETRRILFATVTALILFSFLMPVAFAGDGSPHYDHPNTMREVRPHRLDPSPISHSDVHDPYMIYNHIHGGALREQSSNASTNASSQGIVGVGEPGVLDHYKEEVADGSTLFSYKNHHVCNDFNKDDLWQGTTWTNYFAGWGTFGADDGYYQLKNVTFDLEQAIGPGDQWDEDQASMKIASNQPYDAGVMSPTFEVPSGAEVRVVARYLIYNHDVDPARNYDYASMGVIPAMGEKAHYTHGYQRGMWSVMDQTVIAYGGTVTVMLQGHSPDAINSNIYFDDVEIYVNGQAMSNCKG